MSSIIQFDHVHYKYPGDEFLSALKKVHLLLFWVETDPGRAVLQNT